MTIIEILAVVVILALLAALVAPSVGHIRTQARRGASLATIALIDGACKAYHADHDEYPLSTNADGLEGRHRLVHCLTGRQELSGSEIADGKDGVGFRIAARGRAYGPYNGTEKLELSEPDPNEPCPPYYFLDAFDQPILYYRFGGGTYDLSDNNAAIPNPANPDGQGAASLGVGYFQNADGAWYRRDFVLCSAGPDRVFTSDDDPNTVTDDITNFLDEE